MTDLEVVLDHGIDAVFVGTPGGRILYANPAACEMFASTDHELRRVGRSGVIVPEHRAWKAMLEERHRTGHSRGTAPMTRLDDTTFMAEVTTAIFDRSGGEERLCVIVRDATEQVRRERMLAASNATTEALLGGADIPAVLAILARQARVIFDATSGAVITDAEPPYDVVVVAMDGPLASTCLGRRYPPGSLARQVMTFRQPALIDEMSTAAPFAEGRMLSPGPAMAAPIFSADETYGTLFVGAARGNPPYQPDDLALLARLAERTGLTIAIAQTRAVTEHRQRRLAEQLEIALKSRLSIEQAKGVIAGTRIITPDEAFTRLRSYARSHNQDIHVTAKAVIEHRLHL